MWRNKIGIVLALIVFALIVFIAYRYIVRHNVAHTYGPYACVNNTMTVIHQAHLNRLAGLTITDDVEVKYGPHTYTLFIPDQIVTDIGGGITESRPDTKKIDSYTHVQASTKDTKAVDLIATDQNSFVAAPDFVSCYLNHENTIPLTFGKVLSPR